MFGFFKKKQRNGSPRKSGDPIISALLLEGNSYPFDTFAESAAEARFGGQVVSDVERSDKNIVTFQLGDEFCAMALMPAPYPSSDLDGPLETSWMWPPEPPIEQVKRHRSHVLITMIGGKNDPIRRRLALTAITAFAAKDKSVMAVFWPEATLVHYPPVFIDMANTMISPEAPPLHLWVDLRVFRNEDGTIGLFTTGLPSLGHMEIEIPSIDMQPGELRDWLFNIIFYLLEKGPVLKHGETIGVSAEHKIRIQHCPSHFGHAGKVICLEP